MSKVEMERGGCMLQTLLVIRVTRDAEGSVTRRPRPAGSLGWRGKSVGCGGGVIRTLVAQAVELRGRRPRLGGWIGTTWR